MVNTTKYNAGRNRRTTLELKRDCRTWDVDHRHHWLCLMTCYASVD